jgi:hypothetical protein
LHKALILQGLGLLCRPLSSQSIQSRYFRGKVFWIKGLTGFALQHFFLTQVRKVFKVKCLGFNTPNCSPQSIVKEQLTRKVFRNRDLAGSDCGPSSGWLLRAEFWAAPGGIALRCECARVHCALFMATVKVVRHIEAELDCGKNENVLHRRARCVCRRLCRQRTTPLKPKSGLNGAPASVSFPAPGSSLFVTVPHFRPGFSNLPPGFSPGGGETLRPNFTSPGIQVTALSV